MNTFTYQHKGEFFCGFDSKEIFSFSILNKSPMREFLCGFDGKEFLCGFDGKEFLCSFDGKEFLCGFDSKETFSLSNLNKSPMREFLCGFDSKEIFSSSILNKSPMMNFSISDTRISSLSMIFICSCIFFVKPLASSTTGFWYGYFLLMSVSLWKMKNHIYIV